MLNLIAKILLTGLGAVLILVTLISFLWWDRWWINSISNFWQLLTVVSILVLIVAFWVLTPNYLWTRIFLGLLAAAVVYQVVLLVPYTALYPTAVDIVAPSEKQFHVMVSNVKIENRDAERYLALVDEMNPDVVQVIEIDAWWQQALAPLRAEYPHHVEIPQDNAYGMALYSRFPLENVEVLRLEDPDTPAIYAELVVDADVRVAFYGVHPRPPLPANSTPEAVKELLEVAERVQGTTLPVVVAGDFNDVTWSYALGEFRKISGLLELRIGRSALNTFDATRWWLSAPLDHIYPSAQLGLVDFKRLPAYGSDHYALLATLRFD